MQPISCSRRAAAAGDGRLHLQLINPQGGGYCSANSINRISQHGKPGERLPRIARADVNSVQIGPDLITNLLGSRHVCSSSSFVSSRFTGGVARPGPGVQISGVKATSHVLLSSILKEAFPPNSAHGCNLSGFITRVAPIQTARRAWHACLPTGMQPFATPSHQRSPCRHRNSQQSVMCTCTVALYVRFPLREQCPNCLDPGLNLTE